MSKSPLSFVTDLLSLLALEPQGVRGLIICKALYTNDILLKEALQAIGHRRLQDIPADFGISNIA